MIDIVRNEGGLSITNSHRKAVDKGQFRLGPSDVSIIPGQQAEELLRAEFLPFAGQGGRDGRNDVDQLGTTRRKKRIVRREVWLPKPWLIPIETRTHFQPTWISLLAPVKWNCFR